MARMLEFTVFGERQLARALSRFGEGVRDVRPAWEDMANEFIRIEREQFVSSGGRSGGWRPLSPAYAASKPAGRPIMVLSGDLRRSLTQQGGQNIREIRPEEMRLGTRVPYAIFHQQGTRRMPARRVVDLSEDDRRNWVRILQRYFVRLARQAGLESAA
jgi:phage gpG-like protein